MPARARTARESRDWTQTRLGGAGCFLIAVATLRGRRCCPRGVLALQAIIAGLRRRCVAVRTFAPENGLDGLEGRCCVIHSRVSPWWVIACRGGGCATALRAQRAAGCDVESKLLFPALNQFKCFSIFIFLIVFKILNLSFPSIVRV